MENRSEAISLSIINYLYLIPILWHTRIFPPRQFNQSLGDIPIPFYQGDESVLYGIPSSGKHLYSLCDPSAGVTAVPIHSDTDRMTTGSQVKTIKIWPFDLL